jgi:hypothetical protein
LNLMISLSIFSISVCNSSRRAFARSVSCSYLVNVSVQRGDMVWLTYSMFVFISRCSINWTDSVRPARILANSFSIFSI